MNTELLELAGTTPGTKHMLTVQRFGTDGARPDVYIQAALHADEIPGMIAAHYLRDELLRLETAGQIRGRITLVPFANPIGLAQRPLGTSIGRFDLKDGVNFNRQFPDLLSALPADLSELLTNDPDRNVATIRRALGDALRAAPILSPAQALKSTLLGLAIGADWVLDLHCDGEAVMHLYTLPSLVEAFGPLAAWLQAEALLVSDLSGDEPFDEACSRPWAELARRHSTRPIPLACRATTVELRGQADVSAAFGAADAAALVAFMVRIGVIAGEVAPLPPHRFTPTALEAVEPLFAPAAGIIVYRVPVGATVAAGTLIAEIVDPATGAIKPVSAASAGVLFARSAARFAEPGQRLGKIAGTVPRRSGRLLSP